MYQQDKEQVRASQEKKYLCIKLDNHNPKSIKLQSVQQKELKNKFQKIII